MFGLLFSLPLGLMLSAGRRRPRRASISDPRAVAGRACCSSCARDQRLGTMEAGTTCTPCAASSQARARVASSSPVMPFDLARVDRLLASIDPAASPDEVCAYVLQTVYPRTREGVPIRWSQLSPDDPWPLHALAARVSARVHVALATIADLEADRAWRASGFPVVPAGTRGGVSR